MNDIIISVATLSAISGTLALFLSIANRTIANYGEKKLTINGEKEYTVEGGSSLLSTLMEQDIFIPSACGGKGSCGYCKVQVLEGGGQVLPTEMGYLTEKDLKNSVRLSCQCKVKEDIKIAIPEELFNVRQYEYNIAFMHDVTDTIKHVRLELPPGKEISFKPGQYIQIFVPPYEGNDEEIYRAYSVASAPSDNRAVELFVGYIPKGITTTYVHKILKTTDKLTMVGPFGHFYYLHSNREMIMVAGGTGLAPILSILRYMNENQINRKCTFFFGARSKKDLFFMDELRQLEKDMPDFTLIPALTSAEPEDNWTGDTGFINNVVAKHMPDCTGKEAYMCGSPIMINATAETLKSLGMAEEHIYYDKFE
jgi:Na+-transporting NADH:ubiquinone oxidoreductase subunit F